LLLPPGGFGVGTLGVADGFRQQLRGSCVADFRDDRRTRQWRLAAKAGRVVLGGLLLAGNGPVYPSLNNGSGKLVLSLFSALLILLGICTNRAGSPESVSVGCS
jgi:peptidoglycan/LPS O-acetylase OafA/YrhL